MTEPNVLYDAADGVATITLNEPARMNPLSDAMQRGLLDALQRVRDDASVRALLFTARGKGFCVGADLADLSARSREMAPGDTLGRFVGRMMEDTGNPIVAGLRSLPVPVVCAVNGAAAGGGVGLALAADLVVAGRSAYFCLPFVPVLGVVPNLGASWALPRAIGQARYRPDAAGRPPAGPGRRGLGPHLATRGRRAAARKGARARAAARSAAGARDRRGALAVRCLRGQRLRRPDRAGA